MSERTTVTAHIAAIDEASPVLSRLLQNIKQLERGLKSFNKSFSVARNVGKDISRSWNVAGDKIKQINREQLKASIRSAEAYTSSWTRAHNERLRSAQRLHASILRLENDAHRRSRLRQAASFAGRNTHDLPRHGRTRLVPAGAYGLIAGGSAAVGIKSAFKTRMLTDTAETSLRMFGDLTGDEVKALRKEWADKAGIKYGLASRQVIDAFTESMKAGIPKDIGREFTDIVLKSGTGLDLDFEATTRLAARTATLAGDLKRLDPKFVYGFLNSVAIANRESAADANEIVEANRRGISALTSSKMSPEDLSAFTAAGISTGIQPGRAGTFMGFIVSELINSRNETGQRGKDLQKAAGMLGFGSKANMSARMANDPTATIQEILAKLESMPEVKRTQVADLLAMREWRDELLAVSKVRNLIANILSETKRDINFLDKASVERLKSLSGRWNSVVSAFTLWGEKFGAGFEEMFTEIAEYFSNLGSSINADAIKLRVQNFVRGLREGFGFESWGKLVAGIFDDKSLGNSEQWLKVGRGISEGLKSVWSTLSAVFTSAAKLFGVDVGDSQAMARFVTQFLGFALVLRFMAPAIAVLATITAGIRTFGRFLLSLRGMFAGGIVGTLAGLVRTMAKGIVPAIALSLGTVIIDAMMQTIDVVLDYFMPNRKKLDSKRLLDRGIVEKFRDMLLSDEEFKKKYSVDGGTAKKMSYLNDPYEAGRLFHKAAFIDSGLTKPGGMFHLASLGTGTRSAFGSGMRPSRGYISAVTGLGGVGGLGGMLNATPGGSLGNFGIGGRSGAIIRRPSGVNTPSASRGAIDSVPTGVGGRGGVLGGLISSGEGGYGSFNRGRAGDSKGKIDFSQMTLGQIMQQQSARQLFAVGKYQVIPSTMRGAVKSLGLDPNAKFTPEMQENIFRNYLIADKRPAVKDFITGKSSDINKAGSALAAEFASVKDPLTGRGHYDGDRGGNRASIGGQATIRALQAERQRYQELLKSMSPEDAWSKLSGGASATAGVPKPSEAISSVPSLPSRAGGINPSMLRSGGSGATININGNSHDPEALANLVQRRIDEAYNWRTHDIEHEVT